MLWNLINIYSIVINLNINTDLFNRCSLLLTLVFEKVILKDNAKSRTYLNQYKAEILKISSDESNDMFTRIGPALKHVYSATNAYLMSLTSDLEQEETAKKVRRLNLGTVF